MQVHNLYKLAQPRLTHSGIGLNTGVFVGRGLNRIFSLPVWNMLTHLTLLEAFHLSTSRDCWLCNTLGFARGQCGKCCWQKHAATDERHCFGWYSVQTGDCVCDSRGLFIYVCFLRFHRSRAYNLGHPLYPVTSSKKDTVRAFIAPHTLNYVSLNVLHFQPHTHSIHLLLYLFTHIHSSAHTHRASALALLSLTPYELTLWPAMTPRREGSWGLWLDLRVPVVVTPDTSI